MIVTCSFAGCATFSIDRVKYYNEVVAKVGDTNITRYELLSAYNSYGKSSFGTDAMNNTLDLLIDREVMYQYAKTEEKFAPTAYQINSAIKSIFDSLDSQMDSYVSTAKKKLNIESNNDNTNTENNNSNPLYKDYTYTKRAKLENVYIKDETTQENKLEYKIVYDIKKEPTAFDELIERKYLDDFTQEGTIQAINNKFLQKFNESLSNEEKQSDIYKEALNLLADDLIDYEYYLRDENNRPYNTVTNDLIYRYFERNFEAQVKSLYLSNIRVDYLKNEKLSISSLEEKFTQLMSANYETYVNHPKKYADAMKDIGTKADTMLYHPDLADTSDTENATKFGYFAHVLLSFDEIQKNDIKELEESKKLGNYIDNEEAYELALKSIASRTMVKEKNLDTGEELDQEAKSYQNIIDNEYSKIVNIADPETRLNEFIKFMFKYTGDTATLSAGMPYVVGTNGYSAMETAFTEEAVRLINAGKADSMTPANTENMVITSYGIHLLYYIGDVRDVRYSIPYTDMNSVYIQTNDNESDEGRCNLYTKVLNPLTKQTYFDMLFDKVYPAGSSSEVYTSKTGYSEFEEDLVETQKDIFKVTKYTTRIKGTKPNI